MIVPLLHVITRSCYDSAHCPGLFFGSEGSETVPHFTPYYTTPYHREVLFDSIAPLCMNQVALSGCALMKAVHWNSKRICGEPLTLSQPVLWFEISGQQFHNSDNVMDALPQL
jgi:hypothetical protein